MAKCEIAVRDGFEKNPYDCENCRYTSLMPENQFAMDVINEIAPGLFDGWGAVNAQLITSVLDDWEIIDPIGRRELRSKIMIYVGEVKKKNEKK